MTPSEIERWALRVVDQVRRGQPNEDARVELKTEWPDNPNKAARQIAAHANPAGGEPILWIIGLDQKRGVIGANHNELANWYKQVESQFDELAPGVTDINISIEGKTIVALLFATARRPFVIKSQNSGPVSNEVPWRGSSSTRSARRSELVWLLDSVPRLPKWEAVSGKLSDEPLRRPRVLGNKRRWLLNLKLYIEPEGRTRVIVPFHRCAGKLDFAELGSTPRLRSFLLTPYDRDSPALKATSTELVIDSPGMVALEAEAESAYEGEMPRIPAHLSIELPIAGGGYPVTVQTVFNFNDANSRWEFGDLSDDTLGVH